MACVLQRTQLGLTEKNRVLRVRPSMRPTVWHEPEVKAAAVRHKLPACPCRRRRCTRVQSGFAAAVRPLLASLALYLGGYVWANASLAAQSTAEPVRILLVAGPKSHGPGEHDFPLGASVLQHALNESGLKVSAEVVTEWPKEEHLAAAAVIVLYGDGLEAHLANGHAAELRRAWEGGSGLAVLHFALEPSAEEAELRALFDDALGGAFEPGWSVNPVWTIDSVPRTGHPLAAGVTKIQLRDEWYFHLRFRREAAIEPVLLALPETEVLGEDGPRSGNPAVRAALARGDAQVLAWTLTDAAGRRGFGFTGGHYHRNWYDDAFRTLVLNGIVWAAGKSVPPGGVPSTPPVAPLYARVEEAIARGDVADVQRHLHKDPSLLTSGRRPTPLLHHAILRRQPDIAKVLIEAGADLNEPDRAARTPLHAAVLGRDARTLELLLQRGADMTRRDQQGWTPLHHTAARADADATRQLLAQGCDPNIRSGLGGTPLHEAAAAGALTVARLLLDAGTDRHIRSDTGATAVEIAREFGHPEMVALLQDDASTRGNTPANAGERP